MRGRTIGIASALVFILLLALFLGLMGGGSLERGTNRLLGVSEPEPADPATNSYLVHADFNGDNLTDMAVAETDASGHHRIVIYLRRDTDDPRFAYYKLGHINHSGAFSASAIMCVQGKGHNDLMLILTHSDNRKELVRYRSQGDEFVELSRDSLNGSAPR